MRDGLRIESAASVTLRDTIQKHMQTFAHVIRRDRAAGASVVAVYTDGLSGAMALVVAGGYGSRHDVLRETIKKLTENFERDLRHMSNQ